VAGWIGGERSSLTSAWHSLAGRHGRRQHFPMLALRIGGFVMCYRVSLRPRTRRTQVPYLHPKGNREWVRHGHQIRARNTFGAVATTYRTITARRRSRPRSASGKGADQRFMCRISAGGHPLPGRRGTNSQQPGACRRRPRFRANRCRTPSRRVRRSTARCQSAFAPEASTTVFHFL
jgi:hypothetical protein